MAKHTDISKKSEILTWRKTGKSIREISALTAVTKSTVSLVIKNASRRSSLERKSGSGRCKMISTDVKDLIIKKINENPRISTTKLTTLIEADTRKHLSRKTIYNYVKDLGYISAIASKKPLLKPAQKLRRLEIAKEWLYWPKTKWEKVIFSDESKFNIIGSDGLIKIWRKPGERLAEKNIIKTMKYGGGGIMVWGCFSTKGVGNIVLIDEIMDRFVYVDILTNNLQDSALKMGQNEFIFQQDNDPKHTSKFAKEFFIKNGIEVMNWPSQSPDLNPIENVWAYIERKINQKIITSKVHLFDSIVEEWKNIPLSMLKNLVNSMKYRAKDVIIAKGGHIDY